MPVSSTDERLAFLDSRSEEFGAGLRALCAAEMWTVRDLVKATGATERTVQRWRAGKQIPRDTVHQRLKGWIEANVSPAAPSPKRRKRRPPSPPSEESMETASFEFLPPELLQWFGLPDDPFFGPENPEAIFLSPKLLSLESALILAIRRRQIVALTGPAGSGKSTLLRRLHGRYLSDAHVKLMSPASLDRAKLSAASLATAIIRDLTGQDTSGWGSERRSELLRTTLEDQGRQRLLPVLFVDEAHHLPNDALLAVKQTWDSHTLFRQLSVILVGQEPLAQRLKATPALRELTGRTMLLQMPALTDQAGDYLRWRFSQVGGDADACFDAGAYKALGARGEHPLWLNNLAVRAMRYAASLGDNRVTLAHVGRI